MISATDVQTKRNSGMHKRGSLSGFQIGLSSAALLSPTHPKHQKSTAFHPDKLKNWDHSFPDHVKNNLWTLLDNAQLTEITCMKDALLAVQARGTLCNWEEESIKSWWHHHYEGIVIHAMLITKYWIPILEDRFHYPRPLRGALDALVTQTHKIATMMIHCFEFDNPIESLLKEWIHYEDTVSTFKRYNDNIGVMLYHAYFLPEEDIRNVKGAFDAYVDTKKRQGKSPVGKKISGFLAPLIHVVGVEKFRNEIMPRYKFPPIMWGRIFVERYKLYINDIVNLTDALKIGIPSMTATELCQSKTRFTFCRSDYYNPNPLATEYQMDERYPPNKLNGWGETLYSGIENAPRTLVKKAVQAEIIAMSQALVCVQKRGPLQDWEVESIQKWFKHHYQFVKQLHYAIVKSYLPRVEKRIRLPEILREESASYIDILESISVGIDSLGPGDDVGNIIPLWTRYEEATTFSVQIVNPMYMALYRAYYSREEQQAFLAENITQNWFDNCLGPLIFNLGKEQFRKSMMVRENLSDLQWHMNFGSKYIDYAETVVIHIEALAHGIPPKQDNRKVSRFLSYLQTNLSEECMDSNNEFSGYFQAVKSMHKTGKKEPPRTDQSLLAKNDCDSDIQNLVESLILDFSSKC